MVSRLRRAIILQRRAAYDTAVKAYKEYTRDFESTDPGPFGPSHGCLGKLPHPRKLFRAVRQRGIKVIQNSRGSTTSIRSGPLVTKENNEDWTMMEKHRLWVRVFDKYDRIIFNHADPCVMHVSQMIHLCTKLVNHLNLISQTNEMEVQEALGTLEGTIEAQLTPPPDLNSLFHSWNLQGTDTCHDVDAIAIIRQDADDTFKGQLIDDFIGATFQLQ
ncbi:hypothetical protein LCGC14_2820250 [marine sediment metagenome]|uniref:Uncharacterized protein n=1 Tax=marine sediment metagenome TaxID=412755 RepID=A0A0F9B8E5_9ZZZZ